MHTLEGDVNSEGAMHVRRQGIHRKFLYPPLSVAVNLKLFHKKEMETEGLSSSTLQIESRFLFQL